MLDCTDLTPDQVQRILAWSGAVSRVEVNAKLQTLLEQLPSDEIVTTKYGYNSREKKYGYRMGIEEAKQLIQSHLKEGS